MKKKKKEKSNREYSHASQRSRSGGSRCAAAEAVPGPDVSAVSPPATCWVLLLDNETGGQGQPRSAHGHALQLRPPTGPCAPLRARGYSPLFDRASVGAGRLSWPRRRALRRRPRAAAGPGSREVRLGSCPQYTGSGRAEPAQHRGSPLLVPPGFRIRARPERASIKFSVSNEQSFVVVTCWVMKDVRRINKNENTFTYILNYCFKE